MAGKGTTRGALYQQVDDAFYSAVKRENGGSMPANLIGVDGKPRKLTTSPQDRVYCQKWKAIAAKLRKSDAIAGKPVKSPLAPCCSVKAIPVKSVVLPSKGGKSVKVGSVKPAQAALGGSLKSANSSPTQAKAKVEPCKNETLVIECGHASRRFKFQLPSPKGVTFGQFEVIDDGEEKITCTTNTTGPCHQTHKGKVFDLYPDDHTQVKTDSRLVFQAEHDPNLHLYSFSELFPWGKGHTPQVYRVSTQTCQQPDPLSAEVRVYPQLDWDVDIKFGYSRKRKLSNPGTGEFPTDESSGEWKLEGHLGLTVVGKKKEFGAEITAEVNKALKFVNLASETATFIESVADHLGGVELKLIYPSLSFKGKWGWQEIEGSPNCSDCVEWEVGFDPLLGASVEVEILQFALKKIPVLGHIIQAIRNAAKGAVDIRVTLKLSGELRGAFHRKKPALGDGDTWGELGGKIEFTAESLAQSPQHHWLCLQWGFGAKIGAVATLSGKIRAGWDGDSAYRQGVLKFDGLDVYAVLGGGIGFQFGNAPKEEEAYEPGDGPDGGGWKAHSKIDKSGIEGDIAYQHVWNLISEKLICGGDEKHPLFEGGNL